jgi:3-hydroxybutyryl-CoA dehydrogenase
MPGEFEKVGVVGLGTMGAGIAEVFARRGRDVVGVDQTAEQVESGRRHIEDSTERARRRGRMSDEERGAVLDRVTYTTSLDDVASCRLVIEAVVERLDVKQDVFRRLDTIVDADAVLATNTSSLSVTAIAASSSRPGRVVGLHFFNPAPVQRFVEVVSTVVSSPDVVRAVELLVTDLGKSPVVVGDRAGFIANALLFGYLNAAVAMLESGHASRDDIDAALRLGCGFPMGPFQLLDLVGLDTAHSILDSMYREGHSTRHAPAALLGRLVTAGLVGRKSGQGFYRYVEPAGADSPGEPGGEAARAEQRSWTVVVVGSGARAAATAGLLRGPCCDVVTVGADGDLESVARADLVVDATGGDLSASSALFSRLGASCRPSAVLASASGDLPVAPLAAACGRLGDVVGLHHVRMKSAPGVVEVASTVTTTQRTRQTVSALCDAAGVRAVHCQDRTGLIVDALVYPYLNDAVAMVGSRYATVPQVDAAMRDGCALPAGPFEMLDAVGADVALEVERALFRCRHDPGLAPAPLLEQLAALGYTGPKNSRPGFRDLSEG